MKICKKLDVDFSDIAQQSEERLGKDQTYLLDSSKLRREFKWEEKFNLDSGINDTIEWISKNLDELRSYSWDYKHKI